MPCKARRVRNRPPGKELSKDAISDSTIYRYDATEDIRLLHQRGPTFLSTILLGTSTLCNVNQTTLKVGQATYSM